MMFGLTIEKLFLVALLAAVIIGPRRLPEHAGRLGALIRRLTVLAADAARRTEEETGVATIRQDWRALDPRQYDPRRIIREAWAAGESAEAASPAMRPLDATDAPETTPAGDATPAADATNTTPAADATDVTEAPTGGTPAPAGSWAMAGTSGHPRRVWVPADS